MIYICICQVLVSCVSHSFIFFVEILLSNNASAYLASSEALFFLHSLLLVFFCFPNTFSERNRFFNYFAVFFFQHPSSFVLHPSVLSFVFHILSFIDALCGKESFFFRSNVVIKFLPCEVQHFLEFLILPLLYYFFF